MVASTGAKRARGRELRDPRPSGLTHFADDLGRGTETDGADDVFCARTPAALLVAALRVAWAAGVLDGRASVVASTEADGR